MAQQLADDCNMLVLSDKKSLCALLTGATTPHSHTALSAATAQLQGEWGGGRIGERKWIITFAYQRQTSV